MTKEPNYSAMLEKIIHVKMKKWVLDMAAMCRPDKIVLIDGSEEEKKRLEEEAIETGELIRLDQKKLPGCLYHRSHPNDVARTEEMTFICTKLQSDVGPTNNWMSPHEGTRRATEIFSGCMEGRTLYVIPFSMGPVGSEFSKIGVEITDSIYVVLNMRIMTRVGKSVMEKLSLDGEFTECLHSKADLNPERRLILHFPEENKIWSVGSGYGGNALLGKKCLALRVAGYLGRKEGWLAEHMLILGVEEPNGRVMYVAAAFPSACGKTNLAMMVPPEGLKVKGYKIWTMGDDIAWMRIDTDGSLWAINPEAGCFGVVPGTNSKSNPNAMEMIKKNTIFTNVALKPDMTVWWEGADGETPKEALDWRGKPWKPGIKDEKGNSIKAAHPNSRFTAPISQCPSASFRLEQHHGVPISAILFGGRRAQLTPLVFESFDWDHGVYLGASAASERTAAQAGVVGEVRRDPMAMLPFCGYNMADYFAHWFDMGRRMEKAPKIFHVNWFRMDEKGNFLWPGFGDNLRVIEWILDRCEGKVDAVKTAIGYLPKPEDIDMTGLNLPSENIKKLFEINLEEWKKEQKDQEEFFKIFGKRLPSEMTHQCQMLKERLEGKR